MINLAAIAAIAVRTASWPPTANDGAWPPPDPVRNLVAPLVVETTRELIDAAPGPSSAAVRTSWGCVLATEQATSATAESITGTLVTRGPRWLEPDAFLYYSPHALTGEATQRCGLGGPGMTLRGPSAGVDGLGYAADLVVRGRCPTAVVVAVEALTCRAAASTGQPSHAGQIVAVGLLLTLAGTGPRVRDWRPGGTKVPDTATTAPRVVAPLLELAERCRSGSEGTAEVVGGTSRVVVDLQAGR